MVLLGDIGQVKACISAFGDSINPEARLVLGLHQVEGHFGLFGDRVSLGAR
jgi:hypothetical protein